MRARIKGRRNKTKLKLSLIIVPLILAAILVLAFKTTSFAYKTDGRMVYGASGNATPQARLWDQETSATGAPAGTQAANTVINWTINQAAPNRIENIAGTLTTNAGAGSNLYIQRWNGSAWSNEWNVSTANANFASRRSFDVAYEDTSGHAMVVYSTGTNPQYRIWDGNSWTAAANTLPADEATNVEWIELASRPNSNEIALLYAINDGTGGYTLKGIIWDGNAWGNQSAALETNLAYASAAGDTKCFDAAYENSGDLLVAFGWNNTPNNQLAARYVTKPAGGAWGAPTAFPTWKDEATIMQLAPEPGGDRIAAVSADSKSDDMQYAIWDGATSAWINPVANADNSMYDLAGVMGEMPIAAGWVRTGASPWAIVVYADNATNAIHWSRWNGSGWGIQTDWNPGHAIGYLACINIDRQPGENKAMVTIGDSNSDLWAMTYDGSTWANADGGVALTTNLSSASSVPFAFTFDRYAITNEANGTDPANKTVAKTSTNIALDTFTLNTNSGIDTVTDLTFAGNADFISSNVTNVRLFKDNGSTPNEWDSADTLLGTGSIAGTTATFSGLNVDIGKTTAQYLVAFDVAGTATDVSVTGTVSAITCTNTLQGSDTSSATITIDATPSGQATGFFASDGDDAQSDLSWTNPTDPDFLGIRIMRRSDGVYPTGPSDPLAQQVWEDTTTPVAITYTDIGPLTNGIAYKYSVFTRDAVGNWNTTVTPGINADTGTPGPTITVTNSPVATDTLHQGQAGVVMQKLGFSTDFSTATLNSVTVDRTGSASDSDISSVKIFTDLNGNGVIDGGDTQIGSGTFSGGSSSLSVTPQTITTTPSCLLVVYDISGSSNTSVTAGSNIVNQNSISASGAYQVAAFTNYGSNTPNIASDTVSVTSTAIATVAHRGQSNTTMQKLGFSTDYGTASLTAIKVAKLGTIPDNTITAVKIFTDLNGNGVINGADTETGSGTFTGGQVTITLSSPQVITTAPSYLLVAYDISDTAVTGDTLGSSIVDESCITIAPPDTVAPFANLNSNLPAISGSAESLEVSHTPPPDFNADQGSQNQLLDTLNLYAPAGDGVVINGLRIDEVGTAFDSDLTSVALVRDSNANGVFNPGVDIELASTTFSGGRADFPFSSFEIASDSTETLFVTAHLSNTANIGATVKSNIVDAGYFTMCHPDTVTPFGVMGSAVLTIQDKPDTLDIAQTAVDGGNITAGTSDHVVQVLDLSTVEDTVGLTTLTINRTGTATDSDTAQNGIKLWFDADNSNSLNPGDQQLSTSKTFSAGAVTFDGIDLAAISPSASKKLLVTYSLPSDVGVGRTIGASIENTSSAVVGSPDKVSLSVTPLSSILHTIAPIPPTIPTGLQVIANSNNKFNLNWNDNPANEYITHYDIYRSDSANGPFNLAGSTGGSGSAYVDTVPSPGNYWYRVSGVNDTAESLQGSTEIAASIIADDKASSITTVTIESADAAVKLIIPPDATYTDETFTIISAANPPAPGIQLISKYYFEFQTNVAAPFARPLTLIFRCNRIIERSDVIYHYNDSDNKWEVVTGGQYVYDDNDPYTIGYTNITHFSGYGVGAAAFGGYNDPLQYVTTPGPHGGYTDTTNKCRECHAVHIATGTYRLTRANVRSETCDFCHGDGGASIKHIVLDEHGHGISTDQAEGIVTAPDDTDPPYTKNAKLWGCLECHSVHDNQTIKLSDLSYGRLLKSDPNPAKNQNYLHYTPVVGESTQTVSQWCSTCHNANFGSSAELKTVAMGAITGKVAGHSSSAQGSTTTSDGFADVKYDGTGPTCQQCHTAAGGSGTSEFPHSSGLPPAMLKAGTTATGIDNVCTGCHNTASVP